jgi:segregation and condensation protein B
MNNTEKQINFFENISRDKKFLKTCIEGILFISDVPVKIKSICDVLNTDKGTALSIIKELQNEYVDEDRGFVLREVGGGYRLYSNPSITDILKHFVHSNIRVHLTKAALETLAIIAYRQPVTRTQIAEIRGVKTDSVVLNLLNKGLVKDAGRLKEPGNPIIYKTTDKLLEVLGLNDINELPSLENFKSMKDKDD